ncbi:MAG TPA: hypothetical protein EYQ53_05365 [Candidatus Poseidoniales archaeon]|jgi:hypothetical protein|nr:MAG: hypothetical protein CXT69_02075 [Euryarchaeota archaeon]HIG03791.1 hypothetical protein [Candidatus Poseidoniales archaeon]HIK78726.1 hypothetical protein [Candidatus Poseidoniales archaeon]
MAINQSFILVAIIILSGANGLVSGGVSEDVTKLGANAADSSTERMTMQGSGDDFASDCISPDLSVRDDTFAMRAGSSRTNNMQTSKPVRVIDAGRVNAEMIDVSPIQSLRPMAIDAPQIDEIPMDRERHDDDTQRNYRPMYISESEMVIDFDVITDETRRGTVDQSRSNCLELDRDIDKCRNADFRDFEEFEMRDHQGLWLISHDEFEIPALLDASVRPDMPMMRDFDESFDRSMFTDEMVGEMPTGVDIFDFDTMLIDECVGIEPDFFGDFFEDFCFMKFRSFHREMAMEDADMPNHADHADHADRANYTGHADHADHTDHANHTGHADHVNYTGMNHISDTPWAIMDCAEFEMPPTTCIEPTQDEVDFILEESCFYELFAEHVE